MKAEQTPACALPLCYTLHIPISLFATQVTCLVGRKQSKYTTTLAHAHPMHMVSKAHSPMLGIRP